MNAVDFLKQQHREVEDLFEQFENAGEGAGKEKKQIFEQIREKLEMHTKLEEKLFYPEAEEVDEDTVLEAYEEHDVVKGLLRKIAKTKPSDDSYDAKVCVLKEMVEHHVEEEEDELFPECEKDLGEERLEEIGMQMQEMFERLQGGSGSSSKGRGKTKRQPMRVAA
jgi:hemerythrin-like domain-containing protein